MTIKDALEDTRTIAATERATLKAALRTQVENGLQNYGGSPDNKSLDWTAEKLCDELYKKYGGLSVNEIEYIIDNGTKGNYGNDFSISVKNILRWCSMYLFSDEYINEKRIYDKQHWAQQIDYDGAIKKKNEESLWELLGRYYAQINKGEPYEGLPINQARVYDFLRAKGLTMVSSRAEERQIMLAALEEAKRPRKADIWTAWMPFDETTRAKAICLERLIRNNLPAVYNILMHKQ